MIGIGLNSKKPLAQGEAPPWWALSYPGATFVADFANNRGMINNSPVPLTDFLSITRNADGYAENTSGDLISYNAHELRLSNKGVLIESARSNLVKDSQNYLTTDWSSIGPATITISGEQAPDGTLTVHHIQNLTSTGHGIRFDDPLSTVIAGGTFTASVYLKADNATSLDLTVSASSGSGSPTTIPLNLTTEWQRFTLQHSFAADDEDFAIELTRPSSGNIQNYHIWGVQLEAGSYETSYIKTTNSQVQRYADAITFSDLSWLDTTVGTILMNVQSDQDSLSNRRLLGFASAQGLDTSPASNVIEEWNGSTLLAASTPNQNWKTGAKVALAWNENGRSLCIGGGNISSDNEHVTGLSSWYLGSRDANQAFWSGYQQSISYYGYRMQDSEIQNLTN